MIHPMRRSKQQMTDEDTWAMLERGSWGTLSVAGDDGYPYGVPVNYVCLNGALYFHCALKGHKTDAIARNPKVSFCVVDSEELVPDKYTTIYRSAVVFGRAVIVDDPAEKLASLQALGRKYYPELTEERLAREIKGDIDRLHMVRIDVVEATGKQAKELVKRR